MEQSEPEWTLCVTAARLAAAAAAAAAASPPVASTSTFLAGLVEHENRKLAFPFGGRARFSFKTSRFVWLGVIVAAAAVAAATAAGPIIRLPFCARSSWRT